MNEWMDEWMNEWMSNHPALKGQHKKNVFNKNFVDVKMLSYPLPLYDVYVMNAYGEVKL